jgi:hypothetical protein
MEYEIWNMYQFNLSRILPTLIDFGRFRLTSKNNTFLLKTEAEKQCNTNNITINK